uniref:Uncharacterized protein LOC105060152 isoform X1 n=1 Tax=Elaeis guineensis var. tenera TaxID=51953 RepID=A0A8N4F1J3_ELAGV|nr:uncharacterized protein LOC105060152 isoform X1 [Elaeis guineensis]
MGVYTSTLNFFPSFSDSSEKEKLDRSWISLLLRQGQSKRAFYSPTLLLLLLWRRPRRPSLLLLLPPLRLLHPLHLRPRRASSVASCRFSSPPISASEPADKDEEVPSQVVSPGAPVSEKKSSAEPPPTPIKMLPPIPEDEQRQLFKWILEEKRKVKPSAPAEKKKIDEEKALLKQFIRSKSIPSL